MKIPILIISWDTKTKHKILSGKLPVYSTVSCVQADGAPEDVIFFMGDGSRLYGCSEVSLPYQD